MNLYAASSIGIAVAVAFLLGVALCVALFPRGRSGYLALALSPAAGLGLCSFLYAVAPRPVITIEFILLVLCLVFLYRRFKSGVPIKTWRLPILSLLLFGILGIALSPVLVRVERLPHGAWDGWAIWNTHARFMYRMGADWKNQMPYTFHGDYPALTPSIAARFWRYTGFEVPRAGALAGLILGLSALAVLIAVLSEFRGAGLAIMIGMLLLGTPHYLEHMATQYADVPMSFFILATLALVWLHAQHDQPKAASILALAGFMAGCAGWTKNEGLLFIAAITLVMLVRAVFLREKITARIGPFLLGLSLPVAVIVVFKITVPVQNDLIENQSYDSFVQHITDPNRYVLISNHFLKLSQTFGRWTVKPWIPLILFFAIRGFDRRTFSNSGYRVALLTWTLVLVGYFFVYVNTPADLQAHLESSFDRLAIHLWPSFLLLLGLAAKSRSILAEPERPSGIPAA